MPVSIVMMDEASAPTKPVIAAVDSSNVIKGVVPGTKVVVEVVVVDVVGTMEVVEVEVTVVVAPENTFTQYPSFTPMALSKAT